MKKFIIPTLVAVIAVVAVAFSYKKLNGNQPLVCDQKYALCSAAQCVPDPTNPSKTICFCEIHEGKNFGNSSCDKRLPKTDRQGVEHVISTFSLENLDKRKNMTCPSGNPWSNCLDQPCVVDPLDPKKAICMCELVKTGDFVTFGGDCDTSTCSTGFWSGADPGSDNAAVQVMMKALGLTTSPQRFCPKD